MTTPNENQNLLNNQNSCGCGSHGHAEATHPCGCGIGECKCGHHESCDCAPGACKCGHGAGLHDDNQDAAATRTEGSSCCGGHAEHGTVRTVEEAATHEHGTRWNDGHAVAQGGEASESGQGTPKDGHIND